MTNPPAFGDAVSVMVEIEPHEAAAGAEKTVTLPGERAIVVRLPAGVIHDTVLRLYGPDPDDPSIAREIDLRVLIRSTSPVAPVSTSEEFASLPPPASPKRGIAWRLFAVGAAVLVLLACGGGAVALTRLTGNDPKLANAGPVTSPTPTLTPLTDQEYRAMLTEVDTSMATAIQGVAGARNQPTIKSTAATLTATVRAGQAKLAVIAAPNEAVAAHRTLLRALNLFARVSQDTESAALSNQACTGAAAMTTISNSQGAALMRAAIQELAAVDPANPISIGAWVPAPITSQTRRLANGTFVKKGTRNGSGQFKIDNTNGTKDAAVSLATVGSKVSAFTVYVRAGSTFTVTGVKNNTYEFYMAGGVDWDPAGPGFTRDCAFSKNADPLKYASTSQQFNIWTMILNPATPGNTRAEEVNPDEFPQ